MLSAIRFSLTDRIYRTKFAYIFVALLAVASLLLNFISITGFLQGKIILSDTINAANVVFLFGFSFLAAISVTLHLYKTENLGDKKIGKAGVGFFGMFAGLCTSACAVCYPVILTVLGVPAALAILPFGGMEVQALSIALLLLSIYFVSRGIENCRCAVCK